MSKIFTLAFFYLLLAGAGTARGQSRPDPADSSSAQTRISSRDSASSENEMPLPLTLRRSYDTTDINSDSLAILLPSEGSWMHEPRGLSPGPPPLEFMFETPSYSAAAESAPAFRSGNWLLNSRANLMSPWKLEMESQSKYKILRTILGSVQVGGLAYLMYLHFKKYGLR